MQEEYDLEVDWRGFELHPETPRGGMPLSALFPAARIPTMHEHLKKFAASFGVADLTPRDWLPNTRRALAMAEFARDQDRLTPFRNGATEAHWRRGENIEDDAVLRSVAAQAGLDPDLALRAADDPQYQARIDAIREEAGGRGVTGIPTFFFGDQEVVGCQPYEVLADAAERAGARRPSTPSRRSVAQDERKT